MNYPETVKFHGHECPGLAIGYRMADAAMKELKSIRSGDEEIVAIVENNACGVDALQCITGCTFGKGNLIFKDYGKQAYTLYSRDSRSGVRVLFNGEKIPEAVRNDRNKMLRWILQAPENDILSLTRVSVPEPEKARIFESVKCDFCHENVMKTRLSQVDDKNICIPCSANLKGE